MEESNSQAASGAEKQFAHPKLENNSPEVVTKFFYGAVSVLEKYGWLILLVAILVWFLIEKLRPLFNKWQNEITEYQDKKNEDPNKVFRQQETMEIARRRMQKKIDADVARHKERHAELEMQRRREKIEDWERHRLGQGYKSKIKKPDANEEPQATAKPKPKFKKPLKQNDYNPLTGQGGGRSSGYKPSSRRGGASGGG